MAVFRVDKVVSALPGTLTPSTVYAVRYGAGFDLYISDQTGSVAHPLNAAPAKSKTVVVDLGATARRSGQVVVADAAVVAGDVVLMTLAPGPYPGKGTLADEAQACGPIDFVALAQAGQVLVYWSSRFLQRGSYKVSYSISKGF